MQDRNAWQIGVDSDHPKTIEVRDGGWKIWANSDSDTVLVMRAGSIGDLVLLTPALRAWKLKNKDLKLALCTFPDKFPIFEHLEGVVDELVAYPLPFASIHKYREIITLEDAEMDNEHHMTDVFAKELGVPTPLKDYRPAYVVTPEEQESAKQYIFQGRPTLAVQTKASVRNRNYPEALWLDVLLKLERRGWGIVLLGRKGQLSPWPPEYANPFIRDLSVENLPLRTSVAVLSLCQALCGVDSAMVHFAAALELPAVGLYGPFPWQIRTSKAPKTTAIMGVGPCAGCCYHMVNWRHFPKNRPCTEIKTCVVLASIKTDRIVTKVDLLKP